MKSKWLVGIDEAGRGPLAGPVAVGVFAISIKNYELGIRNFKKWGIKDSKKLNPQKREELYKKLVANTLQLKAMQAVGFSSPQYIDKHGIVKAIKMAMKKALNKLKLNPAECKVFLDGSLVAPPEYKNQKTIIKGDDLIPVISAASICAKVLRDRYMVRIAKKFSDYGFEIHKGYGTLLHRQRIKKYGLSPEHRRTFCAKL